MGPEKDLTLERFDEEVQVAAVILQSLASRGLSLSGFVSDVLPYAVRLQELRCEGFKGKVVLNVSDEGKIKHSEEWVGTTEQLRQKYQIR